MNYVVSLVRLAAGLLYMAVAVSIFAVVCVFLLPWRSLRIRLGNLFGHITGPVILWLTGATMQMDGMPRLIAAFPAIYVSNHTSALDIFIGIWLAPFGVCGVAKKQVVWYPFFGQLYFLCGHLLLDRANRESAVEALRRTAVDVRRFRLGIWMWPEGTRSKDGCLQPFKKGFVHLALATGLPVVPVVVGGAHRAWRKNSAEMHRTTVTVRVLEPIPTVGWSLETLDAHVEQLHSLFVATLPSDQRPGLALP